MFFHKGRAAEEADKKMPLSPPPQGDHAESGPSRTPKKHTPFHIWRSKKKQQPPPSDCGVFVPHPPPAPLCEARALEVVDRGHVAPECQRVALHRGESHFLHITSEVPGPLPMEPGMFKKSRAQPPEENKRKPVLGKLGNLFTAGRRRTSRNGLQSPTSSSAKSVSPKDVASSNPPERENEKSKPLGNQPKQTDTCEEGSPQEKPQGSEEHPETCIQVDPPDAKLSPCTSSQSAAAAGQQCHECDSLQLEPLEAEGESFPGATTAAKQLHSSPENSSRQENAETLAHSPAEDASPGTGFQQETAQGAKSVPGSPTRESSGAGLREATDTAPRVCAGAVPVGPQDTRSSSPEDAAAPPGDPPAEGEGNRAGSAQADGKAGTQGQHCRPGERTHPATVLTLDIYLSKTEVAQVDEPVAITPGAEDFGDSDDMEKRPGGRRSGRRRRSQKSTDSPGADTAPPDSAGRDDAVFDYEVAPNAATENGSAEKKVKSPRAAPDGGVASAASAESKPSPGSRGQLRGESERGKQPPQASSPTKRRGKSRVPEAAPTSPAGGPRAPAKESPPKRAPAPDPAAKGAAGDNGEEAARVIPRELTVKSSSLLPDIKPEHKRGLLPNHFDGRGEASRSKELGRSAGGSDAESLKPRNHFGVGRSTVTTKVTLPAKPKHVELNLKTPKNPDSLGNEHNPFSQPVHKGNTANKISLFENKRANSSPRHADIRGTRNTPASNKTFVGRAKLNLAKKAKEMEQSEKKVMPSSHQNGMRVKETSAESKVTEEEIVPAAGSPGAGGSEGEPAEGQALGCPLTQGDRADVQTDAGCPSEAVVTALIPVKDHKLLGEDDSKPADSKRLVLKNMTDPAEDIPALLDTKESPPTAGPKPQDTFSDSQPPAESSNGLSLSQPAPKDTCVEATTSNFPCTDLKVSENHNGCVLSQKNDENVPPSKLAGEGGEASPPLSTEHSPGAVGTEGPSKVLVQVRSFMLPVENTQDVGPQVLSEISAVREAQLPSCHNDELEVVSVASCAPQKEEVLGNESTSPKHTHCKEEHAAKSGPQVMPPEPEKTLPIQAQSQGDRRALKTESSPVSSSGDRNPSEAPQSPHRNVANGQDSPASLLNISAGSDDSVFDSSSDMEKFTEIIKKMDSTVCVPQKKKKSRVPNSPAPHFVMPPIHEDNLEKVLDPNVFTFGLGKKRENQPEMSPALQLMQNLDTKSKLRSKRTSTEQSILFKSLYTHTNGKDEPLLAPETNDKENKEITNGGVKRSRLEKSALFSSMLSSLPHDKIFSPSVTSVSTMTTSFGASQNSSLSRSLPLQPGAEGAPPCGSDKEQPNLPANSVKVFNFNTTNPSPLGLKSPGYMEKYLPKEEANEDLGSRSNPHLPEMKFSEFSKLKNSDDLEKANHVESVLKSNLPNYGNSDTDLMGLFKSGRFDPSVSFSAMSLSDPTTLRGSVPNKINPRPGKVVIYRDPDVSEECIEVFGDIEDCTSWSLSPVVIVKVVRGCWILYEKPNFEGHSIPLEEGELELSGLWCIEDTLEGNEEAESAKPVVIGSLRHVVQDYRVSQIDLFTEPEGLGLLNSYFDDTEEMQGFGIMQKTCSIKVHWGTFYYTCQLSTMTSRCLCFFRWVAYENPDFTGEQYILDKGFYTSFEDWGGKNCKISSVQPIYLDSFTGPRRRNQIQLFSEPQFQGRSLGFEETTSQIDDSFSTKSCRVLGGSWVAYDGENFSGNQYVLEEGHYPCVSAMGCLPEAAFKSLRFIDVEFSEPTIILFEREGFKGKKIELNSEIVNLRSLGFNTQIRSVQVIGGIWVTYEYGNYRGRQFLLSPAEVPNWYEFSGCRQIGSLRPFAQKRIYFRLRNKATGLFMSTNGNLEDLKLLRIQVMEDVGADDQIWIYQEGCIKCRIAEDCCLTIVGSLVTSGSKLGLALDQNVDSQFWSMKSDGRIYSKLKPNLVLDVKGGTQYDQNHIILNTVSKEKLTQVWEAMVL
uniref:beta/gamma crystallin domain-containing protein 1 n=1 Tax=Panthera onca TaxID=9690 RepID=UPI0029544674|nr:beta/gamma crystallin domain-containing protein 1 [Panthera onca]